MLLKTVFFLFCCQAVLFVHSQNISQLAVFDGDTYTNSGIYGTTGSIVYRYSYYYNEWFPLSVTGLPVINGKTHIKDIAVADTGTSYTSGIYIIADTAVYNYNWYAQQWYPLSNDGLIRKNDTVQIAEISVSGKGTSTDHSIFCVSDTLVFKYEWYYPKWFALYNTGLSVKAQKTENTGLQITAFPNPFVEKTNIEIITKTPYTGNVEIAIFDVKGDLVLTESFKVFDSEKIKYSLNKNLQKGVYFCEIKAGNVKAVATLVAG